MVQHDRHPVSEQAQLSWMATFGHFACKPSIAIGTPPWPQSQHALFPIPVSMMFRNASERLLPTTQELGLEFFLEDEILAYCNWELANQVFGQIAGLFSRG